MTVGIVIIAILAIIHFTVIIVIITVSTLNPKPRNLALNPLWVAEARDSKGALALSQRVPGKDARGSAVLLVIVGFGV